MHVASEFYGISRPIDGTDSDLRHIVDVPVDRATAYYVMIVRLFLDLTTITTMSTQSKISMPYGESHHLLPYPQACYS